MKSDTTAPKNVDLRASSLPGFPLSCGQESLWFLEQMAPGTALYNMPEGWRFTGELNREALEKSLEAIVQRHEILRTVFAPCDGIPRQIVLPRGNSRVEALDLSRFADPEKDARRFLEQEARRAFDLEKGPLLRVHLLRLAEAEHLLLINMHHIVSDAWSFGMFMREFAALYEAFSCGLPSPLQELPVQYSDFAVWQRESMEGEVFQQSLSYWKTHLAGPIPEMALALDHSRPENDSHRGATQFFSFPKALSEKLKCLSRGEDATLFMTVLAAFATLLHRYTGQPEVVIGCPLSGRDRVETEQLFGFFINTHALRLDLGGDPTFIELIRRVREVTLAAYANQAVPFESVVKSLQPERTAARYSFYQVVFGLQTAFTEHWQIRGLETERIELETGTAKFDWTFLLTETSRDLGLRFEYKADLFESETIRRVAAHFQRLLEEVTASPFRKLSEFALLSGAERQQLLVDWNRTDSGYERYQCIHEVFEARAREQPEAVALVFQGKEMTYGELNAHANSLARRLQSSGVGAGTPVGICMRRSNHLVIGLLAILKAGGVYVPLDRSYPAERLGFMMEDSGVALVLLDADFEGARSLRRRVKVLNFEPQAHASADLPNLPLEARPEQPAYIMYSSGSTGVPKGAAIPHRAVVRLVRNTNYIKLTREETLLLLAPISFDASTFEIWGALLNGARLVIYPPDDFSLEWLGRIIEQNGVTTLWLTAGLFHQMVDSEPSCLSSLRHLLAGGDRLSVDHVRKAQEALKHGELINGYGPTENTTFSCCYRVPEGWQGGNSVPIGKPISNTRVYVLDAHFQPVPIGVPGELFLGGDGLATGYVERPALTAEKFVFAPIPECRGERLYRTGDRVRWLPDGNLEFLGRLDNQLKIRGFRVEPGEIEVALRQCPGVRGAIVTGYPPEGGQKRLVAYVVPAPGHEFSSERLRQFLEARLPDYLVPAHFLSIERLPLTPNGKVDLRLLPAPGAACEATTRKPVAPRTEMEQRLVEIWSELLANPRVGIRDNFFHLGGHSLLATQLVSRIAKAFQVELPVRAIFETPTIANLATSIGRAQGQQHSALDAIPRRDGKAAAQGLLARLEQLSEDELEQLLRSRI